MNLIVGLGNPGEKYSHTRHNIGFMAVDALVEEWAMKWENKKKIESAVALDSKAKLSGESLALIKPQTYMNRSGESVAKFIDFYKLSQGTKEPKNDNTIYILHDDLDLDLGRLKIQRGGGAAGHHGVESIQSVVRSQMSDVELVRFRMGIGRPTLPSLSKGGVTDETIKTAQDYKKLSQSTGKFCAYQVLKDYVLGKFTKDQRSVVNQLINTTIQAMDLSLKDSPETAMNKFN